MKLKLNETAHILLFQNTINFSEEERVSDSIIADSLSLLKMISE